MDDNFKSRVDKIFGSLQSSKSSSSQQQRPPLWSLTDDEVERREWRRESAADQDEKLCSSSFDEFLKEERRYRSGRSSCKKLEDDLGDEDGDCDDEDGDSSQSRSRGIDGDGDEWEIRSCLGMDSTLDHEEEEDEFDKVAAGRENAGERLYMSDISDYGSYLNSQNVLYSHTSKKDRCANRMAAKIRLKEDDQEALKLSNQNGSIVGNRESIIEASHAGCRPRSILKRKDNSVGSKPEKRVRFDPACKHDLEESPAKFEDHPMSSPQMDSQDSDDASLPSENVRAVPDYIQNPSRYTRYSFDSSSEVDDDTNAQACMDFLELVQKLKHKPDDAPGDLPKSITFIPKRKSGNVQSGSSESDVQEKEDKSGKSLQPPRFPVGIAAVTQHCDVGATEDYEPETTAADNTAVIQKGGRSYRVKSQSNDSDE
ncbi:hypothetical protein CCACVL1_08208 [Corchorus capsularis]|uniref:Uncharacterized protein n=1 Tax=Corchorus capsularis TaxID=210143 RepID=A0A1R3J1S5_COCAP|nr:hypothetical protein CCACVL1_08208 [Corchorus capsularis]